MSTISQKRVHGVAQHLRSALLDGAYSPRSRLNEVQLAEKLGVSRTPVRTALQQLAGEGLVEYKNNRGFFVRQFDVADVIDAFEMRSLAEGLAARLAAERGLTAEAEVEIEAALEQGDAGLSLTDEAEARRIYGIANTRFHSTIQRGARTRLVRDVVGLCSIIPQTLSQNVMSFSLDTMRNRAQQHREIYAAILARKPREAEELMRSHVLDVRRAVAHDFARGRKADSRL